MPIYSRPNAPGNRRRIYTYNIKLIRRNYSYTVDEMAELFRLHPNAIRRWFRSGLPSIDSRRPLLVHSSELIRFLGKRQSGRKQRCAPGEMFCCRCRAPRRPAPGQLVVEQLNPKQIMIRGTCELCATRMNRGASMERLTETRRAFFTTGPGRLAGTPDAGVLCDFNEES